MKVELNDLMISVSPLSHSIYIGVTKKLKGGGEYFLHKKDITEEVVAAVSQRRRMIKESRLQPHPKEPTS